MKKPALLSLIRIPPLCAIQRCTSGTGPLATNCQRARSCFGEKSHLTVYVVQKLFA